jgi:hypothetical protein
MGIDMASPRILTADRGDAGRRLDSCCIGT